MKNINSEILHVKIVNPPRTWECFFYFRNVFKIREKNSENLCKVLLYDWKHVCTINFINNFFKALKPCEIPIHMRNLVKIC